MQQARQRTRDAILRKANASLATGVFGYDNVDVRAPDGKRSHVARRISVREASNVDRGLAVPVGTDVARKTG